MDDPSGTFTLYLRGGPADALRATLEPFGSGGEAERFPLTVCEAHAVIGAEVALIRVPFSAGREAVRALIDGLHARAIEAKLVLSDDINSARSPAQLLKAFRRERGHLAQGPFVWTWTKTLIVGLGLGLALGFFVWFFRNPLVGWHLR